MTAKISSCQLAAILFLSRMFSECINYPFEYSDYQMQRFTVILITKILVFAAYIPLILFAVKNPGESFFTVVAGKSKTLGWIIFVLMCLQMVSEAVLCIIKLEFFTSNTLMVTAPSWLLVVLMSAVAVYGSLKGIQAAARISTAILVFFLLMLFIGTISITDDVNLNYLYPAFIESPSSLWNDVLDEFSKNNEFFIFAVLCAYTVEKAAKAVYIYVPALLLCILFMTFLYTVVLGPYIGILSFPSYTLSSQFDIVLFDRLDGLDVIVWTVTAVLKVILFFICIRLMLESLVKEKTAKRTGLIISLVSCASGVYFTENYPASDYLFHKWEFIVIVFLLIIIMPAAAILIKRSINNDQPKALSDDATRKETDKKVAYDEFD